MRVATHPRQSFAITGLTLLPCLIFLAYILVRLGPTHANFLGLGISFIFALLVWLVRSATAHAAAAGGLIAATLYLGTVRQPDGFWWQTAFLPLIALLLLTLFSTHFRRNKKEQLGLAEARTGRHAGQVCANLGAAALAAALFAYSGASSRLHTIEMLAVTAAFVEATADTMSSEIGQAIQGKTILLTSGQIVSPGTDGGMSVAGTLSGCAGGAVVAAVSGICMGLRTQQALFCWLAGVAGIFFDSWLGATLERKHLLGNDAVNFFSTSFSALLAVIFGPLLLH